MITPNTDIATIRSILKKMGYKMKTKSFSWGRNAIYHHIESGQDLTGNVFTEETRKKWIPLFEWMKANRESLIAIGKANKIIAIVQV